MDGGAYLAIGVQWVKIDETNSDITVLWHVPVIAANQTISAVAGTEITPTRLVGENLGGVEMPNPSDITSVVWSAVNLPDGLVLGESTGIISGTPTTPGSYTTNVTVTTNWGTDTKAISIIVAIPDSWKPDIASGQVLYLTAGEEMEPYKITGTNIDLTPQELVPVTTPLLDVNDENYDYVSYLPFDDYPTLDLARKIQWENHGCELITVGEGEHNKRLSFANGGYMIGTGNFDLFDLDGLGSMYMEATMDNPDAVNGTASSDLLSQGAYVCLYNDDLSNYIAFINGRPAGPDDDYGTNTANTAVAIHINSPTAQYEASVSRLGYGALFPYWQNGWVSKCTLTGRLHNVPEFAGDVASIQFDAKNGSDNMGLGDYRVILNRKVPFTHISINYNPRYPNARFSGWLGAFYLRKF